MSKTTPKGRDMDDVRGSSDLGVFVGRRTGPYGPDGSYGGSFESGLGSLPSIAASEHSVAAGLAETPISVRTDPERPGPAESRDNPGNSQRLPSLWQKIKAMLRTNPKEIRQQNAERIEEFSTARHKVIDEINKRI